MCRECPYALVNNYDISEEENLPPFGLKRMKLVRDSKAVNRVIVQKGRGQNRSKTASKFG